MPPLKCDAVIKCIILLDLKNSFAKADKLN